MADWIDLCALGVASSAVLISVVTLRADARGRAAAVQPHVSFYRSAHSASQLVSLKMKSSGLGPLFVAEFTLFFDGVPIVLRDDPDLIPIANALGVGLKDPEFLCEISPGTALPVGEMLTLVEFVATSRSTAPVDVRAIARRFEARVVYRSVFRDELFTETSHDSQY